MYVCCWCLVPGKVTGKVELVNLMSVVSVDCRYNMLQDYSDTVCLAVILCGWLQEKRDEITASKTKCGQEPFLRILLNDDSSTNKVFVVGDTIHLCEADNIKDGFLLLLAFYFLMNLNYPAHYAQMLGLIHVLCFAWTFPTSCDQKPSIDSVNPLHFEFFTCLDCCNDTDNYSSVVWTVL